MVRISAVVISSSAAKLFWVHMALVLASQCSTAACSSAGSAGAEEQAVTARLAIAASETAAARILPVRFISAVPSCRVLVPGVGADARNSGHPGDRAAPPDGFRAVQEKPSGLALMP